MKISRFLVLLFFLGLGTAARNNYNPKLRAYPLRRPPQRLQPPPLRPIPNDGTNGKNKNVNELPGQETQIQKVPPGNRRSIVDLTRKIFGGTYVTMQVGDIPSNHPLVKYPTPPSETPTASASAPAASQIVAPLPPDPKKYQRPPYTAPVGIKTGAAAGYNHYIKGKPIRGRPSKPIRFKTQQSRNPSQNHHQHKQQNLPHHQHAHHHQHHKRRPQPNRYRQNVPVLNHKQKKHRRPIPAYPVPFSFDSTENQLTAWSEVRPFEPTVKDNGKNNDTITDDVVYASSYAFAYSKAEPLPEYNNVTEIIEEAPVFVNTSYDHNQHYLAFSDSGYNSFNQIHFSSQEIADVNITSPELPMDLEPPQQTFNQRRHALSPPVQYNSSPNSLLLNITFPPGVNGISPADGGFTKSSSGSGSGSGSGSSSGPGPKPIHSHYRRKSRQKLYIPPPFPSIRQNYSVVNSYGASSEERRKGKSKEYDASSEDGSTRYIFSNNYSQSQSLESQGLSEEASNSKEVSSREKGNSKSREDKSLGGTRKPLQKYRQYSPTYRKPTSGKTEPPPAGAEKTTAEWREMAEIFQSAPKSTSASASASTSQEKRVTATEPR